MHFFRNILPAFLLTLVGFVPVLAQQSGNVEQRVANPIGEAEKQKRARRNEPGPRQISVTTRGTAGKERNVDIVSDKQEGEGDVVIATGNVQVSDGEILIIANRMTYNKATNDLVAEGDVYFEQQGQRITGDRIEFNYKTRRGTLYDTTAFTNRTPDGTTIVIDANRADKTGVDTYNLENVKLTACEERIPKWSFTARRARIRRDHYARIYNGLFRIKNIPILYIPYASISISKKDRSSGFLLPSSGSSSTRGRTLHTAYYQTLGQSADLLVRSDVFSKRGIGLGFDFRARTDQNSRIGIGSFLVFDRLFGEKGENQGGSSIYVDAVQHFKNGFVAVADVNITSSFKFRQVFSDNILLAISPEERSYFYLNKNWRSFSFNALAGEQSVFVGNSIVKTRQLPSIELSERATRVSDRFPVYFSFDAALEGIRRSETEGNTFNLKTPSVVQRLDFFPRITLPLKSVAGFTLTPSLGVRSTFYSDSLDPVRRLVSGTNLLRNYVDLDLDLRAPALAKVFRHRNGEAWFKHVIEPFAEYRRIAGIDEYQPTLKVDERDLIASTNEVTYGITNRFFVKRAGQDGETPQTHELLDLTVSQKYFLDPSFGGALQEGVRNQFFPINTLSGFAFGAFPRDLSPLNVRARLRPNPLAFADVRFNYDTRYHAIRDLIVGAGFSRGIVSFSQSWFFTRQIEVDKLKTDQSRFDPTTFPGNQLDFAVFLGTPARGPYGGFTASYDLRDRTFDGLARDRRFINLTTTTGWAWDCCAINIQHVTFKAGIRNENRILFAFTLKGIGTFGTENIGQRRRW